MISFSEASDAEPRSHNLSTVFCSFTCPATIVNKMNWKESELPHQDIIRFDVGMHDVALLQEIQGEEELFGIYSDSSNVQSNILAKAFDDVSKIHTVVTVKTFFRGWNAIDIPQRLEDNTEVPAMLKSSL